MTRQNHTWSMDMLKHATTRSVSAYKMFSGRQCAHTQAFSRSMSTLYFHWTQNNPQKGTNMNPPANTHI